MFKKPTDQTFHQSESKSCIKKLGPLFFVQHESISPSLLHTHTRTHTPTHTHTLSLFLFLFKLLLFILLLKLKAASVTLEKVGSTQKLVVLMQ